MPASWSATAGSVSYSRSVSACRRAGPITRKTEDHKKPEADPQGLRVRSLARPGAGRPVRPRACHVNFRWIYDYAGGQVTDWGGHHPDCAQWGMGTEMTGPIEIRNAKAVFPPDRALEHGY